MWTLVQTVDNLNPKSYIPRKQGEYAHSNVLSTSRYHGNNMPQDSSGSDQTMQPRAWGGTSSYCVRDYTSESTGKENDAESFMSEFETLTGNKINMYPSLYRITNDEYRKLSDQVRNIPPSGRYKGQGFKRFYTGPNGETVPFIYRSQLASRNKVFQHSRERPPYENKWRDEPPTRCRSICVHVQEKLTARGPTPPPPRTPTESVCNGRARSTTRPHSSRNRPSLPRRHSASPSSPHSLRSESPTVSVISITSSTSLTETATNQKGASRTNQNQYQHSANNIQTRTDLLIDIPNSSRQSDRFDTLTPSASFMLSGGVKPYSVYGDKIINSGDDDDDSRDGNGDVTTGASEKESDQDSAEEGDEPSLDKIDIKDLPNLNLRPEKIDAMYMPEYSRGDRRKYDFEATNTIQPVYLFSIPLSEEMMEENLTQLSKQNQNWRECVKKIPEDDIECEIIDRLIEFERLQAKTDEWERQKKERQQKSARQREAKQKVSGTIRYQGAKLRERKCCPDCLQLLCIGNCAEMGPVDPKACKICHEAHPTADCTRNLYSSRMRSERVSLEDENPKPPLPPRPKSCNSCQRTHTAKVINANNVINGRSKTCNITFARGQEMRQHRSRDLKQFSATQIPPEVERDLIKLGIDPVTMKVDTKPTNNEPHPLKERPHTACETTTQGRAAICPGKSYFSQRRSSITDLSKATKRVKSAGPRRKSSGKRRPQTALV